MGDLPSVFLPHLGRFSYPERATFQNSSPRSSVGSDRQLTGRQVCRSFFQTLAWQGGGLSLWGLGFACNGLFILQHMLAQRTEAAPIVHVHFSRPLTLLSRLLQRSHPYGLQGKQLWLFILWTFEPNGLTLPPSYPVPRIRWPTTWWSVTSIFCKAGNVSILTPCFTPTWCLYVLNPSIITVEV